MKEIKKTVLFLSLFLVFPVMIFPHEEYGKIIANINFYNLSDIDANDKILEKSDVLKSFINRPFYSDLEIEIENSFSEFGMLILHFSPSDRNDGSINITVIIKPYYFGGITFSGNKVFSSEELSAAIEITYGNIITPKMFEKYFREVEKLYYNEGYTDNSYNIEKIINEDIIYYAVHITERGRSYLEQIIIRGNNRISEEVIRENIPIKNGDIFSYNKIIEGLKNLRDMDEFLMVVPDVTPGSMENHIIVILEIEEK
jgi:outer membrane protein insertion porin family